MLPTSYNDPPAGSGPSVVQNDPDRQERDHTVKPKVPKRKYRGAQHTNRAQGGSCPL